MGYHQNQAQFDRAKWRKRFLLPCWAIQICLLMALIGIFSYRISETVAHYEENDKKGNLPVVEMVWECTNIGLSLLSLLLNTMEVAKMVSETLTPFFMLFTHTIKLTSAAAILALDVVQFLARGRDIWSTTGLAIDIGFIVATLIPTIYAFITFRRLSRYDDYHHPVNVKAYGFSNDEHVELGHAVDTRAGGPYDRHLSTEYHSPQSRSRSASAASSVPTLSSLRRKSTGGPTVTVDYVAPPMAARRESYDHKRDTQFEEYVSRRASVHLKEDIDRAVGAEFGWGGGAASLSSARNSLDRSDNVVVGGGVVASGRPRDSVGRTRSWASEQGLVAVPEEEFDDNNPLLDQNRRPSSEDERVPHPRRLDNGSNGQDMSRAVSPPLAEVELENRKRRRDQ